jgi:hypothetical protein
MGLFSRKKKKGSKRILDPYYLIVEFSPEWGLNQPQIKEILVRLNHEQKARGDKLTLNDTLPRLTFKHAAEVFDAIKKEVASQGNIVHFEKLQVAEFSGEEIIDGNVSVSPFMITEKSQNFLKELVQSFFLSPQYEFIPYEEKKNYIVDLIGQFIMLTGLDGMHVPRIPTDQEVRAGQMNFDIPYYLMDHPEEEEEELAIADELDALSTVKEYEHVELEAQEYTYKEREAEELSTHITGQVHKQSQYYFPPYEIQSQQVNAMEMLVKHVTQSNFGSYQTGQFQESISKSDPNYVTNEVNRYRAMAQDDLRLKEEQYNQATEAKSKKLYNQLVLETKQYLADFVKEHDQRATLGERVKLMIAEEKEALIEDLTPQAAEQLLELEKPETYELKYKFEYAKETKELKELLNAEREKCIAEIDDKIEAFNQQRALEAQDLTNQLHQHYDQVIAHETTQLQAEHQQALISDKEI